MFWENAPLPPDLPWWQVPLEIVGIAAALYLVVGFCLTLILLAMSAPHHHGSLPTPWQCFRGVVLMILLLPIAALMGRKSKEERR